ncbi:PA domain-containing protein [Wukongibacter baidiensis]|uniref:PA domain-containing protein n=1 Tax=Wukongibacter baidiensis TaxID=1723361 RepID=UPI003D7FBD66
MKKSKIKLFLSIVVLITIVFSQMPMHTLEVSAAEEFDSFSVLEELTKEKYMGRQSGTEGYEEAVDFLEEQLEELDVVPILNSDTYKQEYKTKIGILKDTSFRIDNVTYEIMKDYMPYSRTTSGNFEFDEIYYVGVGGEEDYTIEPEGIVVFKWNDDKGNFGGGITDRILTAKEHGAKGVLIVDNGELKVGNYEHPINSKDVDIPVLYISEDLAEDILQIPSHWNAQKLSDKNIEINLEIKRKSTEADNLVGLIPGKREDKAILITTNLDGFGSLPNGEYFQSTKSSAVSTAMLLDLANYYKENKPEYNIIIAIVGSKWIENEGIEKIAKTIDFDNIITTIDLYAMGGDGKPRIFYTDKEFKSFAKKLDDDMEYNNDLGNALSGVLTDYTPRLLMMRDTSTWINNSLTDTFENVNTKGYNKGLKYTKDLIDDIIEYYIEEKEEFNDFDYDYKDVKKSYEEDVDKKIKFVESKYFKVYFDDEFKERLDNNHLEEIDEIYERISKFNYYPYIGEKVKLLYLSDLNEAARIGGREDIYEDGEHVGGGFASFDRPVIWCLEPHLGTVSHELNHLLADFKGIGKTNKHNQECQGQSFLVYYYYEKDEYVTDVDDLINEYLCNWEAPKVIDNAENYSEKIDWKILAGRKKDPDGWQNTYHTLGSMYSYLNYVYGSNAARKAVYGVYDKEIDIKDALIQDTGLDIDEFLESWSLWMTSSGEEIGKKVKKEVKNFKDKLTWYDYYLIFTKFEQTNDDGHEDNDNDNDNDFDSSNIPVIDKKQSKFAIFEDDGLKYGDIEYRIDFANEDFELDSVGAAIDSENVYLKIKYISPIKSYVSMFLQGDVPGLKKVYDNATKKGENVIVLKFNKDDLKDYTAGLAISIGERNFIFIDKELMDNIANIRVKDITHGDDK